MSSSNWLAEISHLTLMLLGQRSAAPPGPVLALQPRARRLSSLGLSIFFFSQYLGEINVSMDNIYLIIHYICAYVWERLKVLNSARKKEMKILILVVLKNWVLKNLRIF